MESISLPETQTALVQTVYVQPLELKTIPVPEAIPGSAVIKIVSVPVISYAHEVLNGSRQYSYTTPLVPGTSGVGRVAALGVDSNSLQIHQLVWFDSVIRSGDNHDDIILHSLTGGFTPGSQKLMQDVWRDGAYAEYTRVPLEAVYPLDEERLILQLRYKESDLATIGKYLVPFGGLKDISTRAGETVIVAPATGGFGGAAVAVAVAMGASVIAMGRNETSLAALSETFGGRIKTVKITEKPGGLVDAVLETSPPRAAKSTILKSCISALRRRGRMSLMGGIREDAIIPIHRVMHWSWQLKGKWMYGRDEVFALIKMVETGLLKIGEHGGMQLSGDYEYGEWEKAFDVVSENARWYAAVVMKPAAM
ncbi:alcohol dehydrogenase [Lentithecium fluviatile CBS 122367]|uniref:Alcohol dehydrogenase n=1 Tax=Lentithecium fluviatile CBS 122367 TaxID=1168545 RepID=A0A6G1IV25_9PLEO|nr:alcohol dehydrogenase [Lentithecium fluviatile CBS 122367]